MFKPKHKAYLVLSDGTVFEGKGFGAATLKTGEVVFNTSMTGYQEILTDPSYQGQIVTMTYPEMGNYGVNPDDIESRQIFASGLVVKQVSPVVSNYRSHQHLNDYLEEAGIPGICEIDTRALVRHIREAGAMPAVIAVGDYDLEDLKAQAAGVPGLENQNLAKVVSCDESYQPCHSERSEESHDGKRYKIAAYDFGIKTNILRIFAEEGFDVTVFPYTAPASEILNNPEFQGVFLSNGPGDPAACDEAISNVKELIGKKPLFGICLGHQILGLAMGAKTYKLKFGHHGGNQPVKDLQTGKVEITAQNHGFAVDESTLPADVEVTHVNLNDGTIEGVAHKNLPVISVQHHPEASPGPHDSAYLFKRFRDLIDAAGN